MKATKIIAATALLSLATAGSALAFHDGGVAYCDGCHTMHNSSGGKTMVGKNSSGVQAGTNAGGTQFQGQAFLLKGSDDSSTCLNCHSGATLSSYHVMTYPAPALGTPPINRTPGGDFAWLTQSYPLPAGSHGSSSPGERHGHNIVANDFGLISDKTLLTAPGGTYQASSLSCASCHDPHSRARIADTTTGVISYPKLGGTAVLPIGASGSYGAPSTASQAVGVYRLLGGANYSGFTADPPVAVAPSTYNRTEAATDTRVAYGKGMSEWCANCHSAIHNSTVNSGNTALIHPAGNGALLTATANDLNGNANGTTIAAIYNYYKKSGDLSGSVGTSYTSLVPFEEGTGLIATLAGHAGAGTGSTAGPSTTTENVMCLSCHRAHAGGFNSMTRWNNAAEFITVAGAWPGTDAATSDGVSYSNGMNTATYQAAMYDRPAGNYAYAQRSLCNKCHAKD